MNMIERKNLNRNKERTWDSKGSNDKFKLSSLIDSSSNKEDISSKFWA